MHDHTHGPDGEIIIREPAPESAAADVEAVETAAGADVEIAKINARTSVKIAELDNERAAMTAAEQLAEMRGEVQALREIVNALQPPAPTEPEAAPEPAPVVIEAPAEEQTAPAPEPVEETVEETAPKKKKKRGGFWGPNYQ